MLKIGFQTEFYTLWEVSEVYQVSTGNYSYYERQDFTYLKNLSKDKTEAVEKACKENNLKNIEIDFTLRGENRSVRGQEVFTYENYQFTFGNFKGQDIRICSDIWQLNRAMNDEKTPETKTIAKNRLIELGFLIEFRGEFLSQNEIDSIIETENKPVSDCYFNDGEKITLELTKINDFSFPTNFGTSCINEFIDTNNRLFKYIGSNPIDLKTGYTKNLAFTVKHSEYNGKKETRMLRIKIKN